MSAHVYIQLLIGAKFTGFCPQNDKITCFNILVFKLKHRKPCMTDLLVCKTSTLKEYLSLLPLLWQPTTAQLNPPHIFIFSYIENVSIQSIFFTPFQHGFQWRLVPTSDPRQIITPLVLVGLGLGVGEGLGLGNQVAISTRGVIIWQGVGMGTTSAVAVGQDGG